MIESCLDGQAPIRLVKRAKSANQLTGTLAAIHSFTVPDAMLTGVVNNIEYPLAAIEFTEAVQTEDHELQRSYGMVASYLADCFYVKIAGKKKSEKVFGGAEYNPYSTPKILQQKLGYEGFIIADWLTDVEAYNLEKHCTFLSCPPDIELLTDTLQSAVAMFLERESDTNEIGEEEVAQTLWFISAVEDLKRKDSFIHYQKHIDAATDDAVLLATWKGREDRNRDLNKLRYFVRHDWIGAKINRFSHAMDPDRGILFFISLLFSDDYQVFGIYALVRKMAILKPEVNDLRTLRQQLIVALDKDEWLKGRDTNLAKILANELIAVSNRATTLNQTIDFTYFWEQYKSRIGENKVIVTLAYFLDGMYLNQNGIKLIWDRRRLLGDATRDFLPLLSETFGFKTFTEPSALEEVVRDVDEDEVTYTLVHQVLITNGFKIISISYPGAQGGAAVLPEPEKGKEQPREYPDIVAISPQNHRDIILGESKGMFKQAEIERDTEKLLRYKTEPQYTAALKETLVVAKVIDATETVRNLIIGVAFGVNGKTTTWNPNNVDFIFRIVDRKRWAIGIFSQLLRDLIPIIEGDTDFPTVYKLRK